MTASRNGSGTFTRAYDWTDDEANSIPITASRFDTEMDGVASELTNSVAADGQTTMSGALKMGGFRVTNVGAATAVTDAPKASQIQDNSFGYLGTTSGTTTAYTLSPSPAVAALVKGQEFAFEVNADNTGSSTLAVSGLTATTFKKLDSAGAKQDLAAGDLQANITYSARYDGTDFLLTDQVVQDLSTLQNEIDNIIQVVNSTDNAVATTTTTIPYDDTIPQNTEGAQFLSVAITPTNASNILLIEVVANVAMSAATNAVGALFRDSTAGALAATALGVGTTNRGMELVIKHYVVAGSASATTFKFRAGPDTGATLTFNGVGGARKFGGVSSSSITITEIQV